MEQRTNIKFCFKLVKKFAETYELLKKVYGDDCMSRTQVYTFTRFQNGRDDLNDDPRPERPEASSRAELVEKVCARFVSHQLNEDQKSQRIFDEKTDLCYRPPSVFAWSITKNRV